jgi:hypothetical protein
MEWHKYYLHPQTNLKRAQRSRKVLKAIALRSYRILRELCGQMNLLKLYFLKFEIKFKRLIVDNYLYYAFING